MTKTLQPIVFFGSGPVAARSLELLIENFRISDVITKPTPVHHKTPNPVISVAERQNITTHTVSTKTELDALIKSPGSRSIHNDVAVLIDFGIIVSQSIIDYFKLGIINSHFSLLPEWRGADPISYAILSGQRTTGVNLMSLSAGMDTGDILASDKIPITHDDDSSSLTEKLISVSNNLLLKTLPLYVEGSISPQPQSSKLISYSHKLKKSDGILNYTKPASYLSREIRAYSVWPKSHLQIGTKDLVITRAHFTEAFQGKNKSANHRLGQIIVSTDNSNFALKTTNGYLVIDKLKPAGKSEMSAKSFMAGNMQLLLGAS